MPEIHSDPLSPEKTGMSDFWTPSNVLIGKLPEDIDEELNDRDMWSGNNLTTSNGEEIDDLHHEQKFSVKTDILLNSNTNLHVDSTLPPNKFTLSLNVPSTDVQAQHPTTTGSHTRRPSSNSVFKREIPSTTPHKQTTTPEGHWTETQRIIDLNRLDTPTSGQVSSVSKTGSAKRKKKPKSKLHSPSSGLPHNKNSTDDDKALADALAAKQAKRGPADSVGGSDAASGSQQEPNESTSTFRCGIFPKPSYGGDYRLRKLATEIEKSSNSLPSTVLAAKIQEVMKSKNTMNLGNALTSEVLDSMTLDRLRVAFKRTQGERTVEQVNLDASNLPGSLCTIRQLLELTKGDVYEVASSYSVRIYPLPRQPTDAEPWYCGGFCRIMIGPPEDSEAVQWRNTILQYPNDFPPSVIEAFKSWSLSQGTMQVTRASAPRVMLSLAHWLDKSEQVHNDLDKKT
ncbi:hypothetical protein M231_00010 [Tremella mesenterica]|uniref:Uncharacterized protein n=1 Tax=Tremella mesenterica TaxID=5217 RepID=A0A4Q1BWK1_TREME|nr:hypothetical protein M231_00010 [Tremella mesenterica]